MLLDTSNVQEVNLEIEAPTAVITEEESRRRLQEDEAPEDTNDRVITIRLSPDAIPQSCDQPILSATTHGNPITFLDENLFDKEIYGKSYGPVGTSVDPSLSCLVQENQEYRIEPINLADVAYIYLH